MKMHFFLMVLTQLDFLKAHYFCEQSKSKKYEDLKHLFSSRALAQICPYPRMHNLISLGGPQQGLKFSCITKTNFVQTSNSFPGFYQYPRCGEVYGPRCAKLQFYITSLAYTRLTLK